ncbi:MAG: nucleotide pyrophosphohydrolase [Saprospiraceae bacterium]|nr:nucleotide pyrophosphohydrolase [Saprospiraceae bacterium]MBK7810435.1 nucleotide pyrophosphohydrolase [Saprospiraceae bacterium]MBK9630027.1 nucleotide pyrophosphohydrolase [Saprospiraceae bacterium]
MKELQKQVDVWINKYGVRYFNELTNLALLTEEIGELAKIMARVYGEQSFKNTEYSLNSKEKIAEELCDIIFVCTCLANQMDIDLEAEMKKNFKKKTIRDEKRHFENKKLRE